MRLEIEFAETDMTLQADFGELYEKPQKEVYDSGYNDGYEVGEVDGYGKGYKVGETDGYTKGETTGYNNGYTTGKTDGYNSGYSEGESKGYENGYDKGYDVGFTEGKESASGGGGASIDSLIDGSATEVYSEASEVRKYCFYNGSNLTKIEFPLVEIIRTYAFYGCTGIITFVAPNVETIERNGLEYCSKITNIVFPNLRGVTNYTFSNCTALEKADLHKAKSIGTNAFVGCRNLKKLILRNNRIVSLSTTNALQSTPIASGTGYIYVPSALVESYKSATNWSTYATQFRALEDYTVDGTITGELDLEKIGA